MLHRDRERDREKGTERKREVEHELSTRGFTDSPRFNSLTQFVPWWNLLDQQKGEVAR